MTLSARNRLEGKVTEIQLGGVMAHVVIRVGENVIESVITKRSADEIKLKVGDRVSAVIKSTEVMLEKVWDLLPARCAGLSRQSSKLLSNLKYLHSFRSKVS